MYNEEIAPRVAIAMPTYQRPDFVTRAIESIKSQGIEDWICCISDDEAGDSKTMLIVNTLAENDNRFVIAKNTEQQGQVGNTNAAIKMAMQTGAQWIKLLHDDDELTPDCLEVFLKAAAAAPDAAIISCQADQYFDGKLLKSFVNRSQHDVIRIEQKYTHLGMYLQDSVGGGIPSQMMVSAKVIAAGEAFRLYPGIKHGVDSSFFCDVCKHGDSLVINRALIKQHLGHERHSSKRTEATLDAEYVRMRELQLQHIDPALNPPSLACIKSFLRIIRGMNRLKRRNYKEAFKLMFFAKPYPRAWWLVLFWIGRRVKPDLFYKVPHKNVTI